MTTFNLSLRREKKKQRNKYQIKCVVKKHSLYDLQNVHRKISAWLPIYGTQSLMSMNECVNPKKYSVAAENTFHCRLNWQILRSVNERTNSDDNLLYTFLRSRFLFVVVVVFLSLLFNPILMLHTITYRPYGIACNRVYAHLIPVCANWLVFVTNIYIVLSAKEKYTQFSFFLNFNETTNEPILFLNSILVLIIVAIVAVAIVIRRHRFQLFKNKKKSLEKTDQTFI